MTKDEIMDRTGGNNWDQIVVAFNCWPVEDIKAELDDMFPQDDNESLAQAIYDELQKDD